MKKIIAGVIFILSALCAYAQNEVTQFLGIPVDGPKSTMIQKLKEKGFRISPYNNEVLEGEFNGINVNLHIVTNGDKVCRIMLCDANPVDERSIQIRFNTLCRQFENNPKYICLGYYRIPDDEDISYEISVNNKRYEACYYQRPAYLCSKRSVWFMISEYYGKYYIIMYYDNEYNRANGEDL